MATHIIPTQELKTPAKWVSGVLETQVEYYCLGSRDTSTPEDLPDLAVVLKPYTGSGSTGLDNKKIIVVDRVNSRIKHIIPKEDIDSFELSTNYIVELSDDSLLGGSYNLIKIDDITQSSGDWNATATLNYLKHTGGGTSGFEYTTQTIHFTIPRSYYTHNQPNTSQTCHLLAIRDNILTFSFELIDYNPSSYRYGYNDCMIIQVTYDEIQKTFETPTVTYHQPRFGSTNVSSSVPKIYANSAFDFHNRGGMWIQENYVYGYMSGITSNSDDWYMAFKVNINTGVMTLQPFSSGSTSAPFSWSKTTDINGNSPDKCVVDNKYSYIIKVNSAFRFIYEYNDISITYVNITTVGNVPQIDETYKSTPFKYIDYQTQSYEVLLFANDALRLMGRANNCYLEMLIEPDFIKNNVYDVEYV